MSVTAAQCRAGRSLISWSQTELANESNVSRATVADFERETRTPHQNNLEAIRSALEAAGVQFIEENGGGPGVRLKKEQ